MMNERGKSHCPMVPAKHPNKDAASGKRGHGEPYTGTKAETPDTDKGEPTDQRAGTQTSAEGVEGRGLAEGNPSQQNESRTQSRASSQSALDRIRQVPRNDKGYRFTALLHHVYDVEALRQAALRG